MVKIPKTIKYLVVLLVGALFSPMASWVSRARDELHTPVCALWTNFSPILREPSRELIAKFYQATSAVEDCEAVRRTWDNGHNPTCECSTRAQ